MYHTYPEDDPNVSSYNFQRLQNTNNFGMFQVIASNVNPGLIKP